MIVRVPYHLKIPVDIAHLPADTCIMSVPCFITTSNTEFGRFRYTVMPFGVTLAGDVFQYKLDHCFGHLKNVIVIAYDIMTVCMKPNHSDHDQALTSLLETARKYKV